MILSTIVSKPKLLPQIDYNHSYVTIGSCFSDSIGMRLKRSKFSVSVNPMGILFNPESIYNSLERTLRQRKFQESDFFLSDGIYQSFSLHSDFGRQDIHSAVTNANDNLYNTGTQLQKCDILFVTFGTSFVYRLSDGSTVSNCHRAQSSVFSREFIDNDTIVEMWNRLVCDLRRLNPKIKIVFTVSPVRHIRDGLHENTISKSNLHLAIDKIIKENNNCCFYFPSYEILLDELRDYRYFADDMCHPSDVAVEFIYQRIREWMFSKETANTEEHIGKIVRTMDHRPRNPQSESSICMYKSVLSDIQKLESEGVLADFSNEKETISKLLDHKPLV